MDRGYRGRASILAFDQLVDWTGTGKKDKIEIRQVVLSAMENHSINLAKIADKNTLRYLSGFKRYSTERVMKSLAGELTANEKWSIKGSSMGECWYKDCCISDYPNSTRCGKPELRIGEERMRCLLESGEIKKLVDVLERK